MSELLNYFNEHIKPHSDKLDEILASDLYEIETRKHPKDCEHEQVEYRDELIVDTDSVQHKVNGLYCIECESYVSSEES